MRWKSKEIIISLQCDLFSHVVPSCCIPTPKVRSISGSSVNIAREREHCLLRNGHPREYILRYGLLGSRINANVTGVNPFSAGMHTVSLLYANAWYKFEVALVNEVGRGPYSSVNVHTGYTSNSTTSKSEDSH